MASQISMKLTKTLLMLSCYALLFVFEANADPEAIPETEVISYLEQFGYLPPQQPNLESDRTEESVTEALSALQTFAGLDVTGIADEQTTRLMRTPRCGVRDKTISVMGGRFRRFAVTGKRWFKKTVTYRVDKYTAKLDSRAIDRVITKAFALWGEHVPLNFRPSESGQADIIITFARLSHGDDNPFDGPGGILGHGFSPAPGLGGDVHFDDDENWTIENGRDADFFQTAVHEIGHALGLDHSSTQASMMYPYQRPDLKVKLYGDDIAGIEALYGTENEPTVTEDPMNNRVNRAPRPYYYGPIWPDYE